MLQASTLAGTPRPPLGCNCGRLPCTQRAPLHPERRTDPLDRSRCRRCRRSALGSRTAAVRALPGVHACGCPNRCEVRPRPHSCPRILGTVVPAAFTHPPCSLAIATVAAGDGAARPVSTRFAHSRSRSAAVSARCAPRIDSHQRMLVHVTHPDRPCPMCAENGVRRRPHTNTTSTLLFHCRTVYVARWPV